MQQDSDKSDRDRRGCISVWGMRSRKHLRQPRGDAERCEAVCSQMQGCSDSSALAPGGLASSPQLGRTPPECHTVRWSQASAPSHRRRYSEAGLCSPHGEKHNSQLSSLSHGEVLATHYLDYRLILSKRQPSGTKRNVREEVFVGIFVISINTVFVVLLQSINYFYHSSYSTF